jgi:hypothetical protein
MLEHKFGRLGAGCPFVQIIHNFSTFVEPHRTKPPIAGMNGLNVSQILPACIKGSKNIDFATRFRLIEVILPVCRNSDNCAPQIKNTTLLKKWMDL